MIFGKVVKTLISVTIAGVAGVVAWPKFANNLYPGGEQQAAALREYLPQAISSALPVYGEKSAGASSAQRPAGGSGRPQNAGGPQSGRPPGAGGRRRGPGRPVPVIVAKATKGEVPFLIETLGTTRAFATVNVKSRVDSTIKQIFVADGAKVKAGETLVELDSRQIQAQIKQAEAALAKDTAENAQAGREVRRFEELLARNAGNKVSVENARLKLATTAAAMASDKAQLENLNVQLSYYTIKAPISGRIGIFNAKTGNTIRSGDNTATGVLVTIIQATPIYVSFSLPQSMLPELRKAIDSGAGEVSARPQGTDRSATGKLQLIENAIDVGTGTVTVHAIFDNKDELLWPGQLCNLRVILRRDQGIVSVPREAMQSGQDGNFVFVIEEGVAKIKKVRILRAQEGREIIGTGLDGSETVVIEGALSLRNGTKVQIRNNQTKRDS
jgi:membrane fusion protein, multidrug efflux system